MTQERQLASIQKILKIEPIPNADRIEKATILGWEVVVIKDQFKVDDLCIYIQIDSLLPEEKWSEFMRERKYRVRTIKLRKQISQGIAFPLDIIKRNIKLDLTEGTDVTNILGVKQWEAWKKPIRLFKKPRDEMTLWEKIKEWNHIRKMRRYNKKWMFPTHLVPKTSETRIQNSPSILHNHKGDLVTYTEKLDGTSATYIKNNGKFYVCSRNLRRSYGKKSVYSEIAKKYNLKYRMKKIIKNIAIQGEIIGEDVENGSGIDYDIEGMEYYVFNVFLIDEQRYMNIFEFQAFCKKYKFRTVPQLGTTELLGSVKEVVEWSNGKSMINSNYLREGLVVRSKNMQSNRWEFSFKVVDPIFLLKYANENND